MKRHAIAGCVVGALVWAAPGWAQTYKCANAAGDITYSGKRCSTLGLKELGEVRDRLSVIPGPELAAEAPAPAPGQPERRDTPVTVAPPTVQPPPVHLAPRANARR